MKQIVLKNKAVLIVFAVFLLLVVVLFRDFLFSSAMLYSSDQLQGLDSRIWTKTAFEHGQFPTWFGSRLSGMPSIDASFGDAMYPPSILLTALFPISKALGLKLVIHVFLAGVLFFFLLRRGFGLPVWASAVGGGLFMLNPQFVSHVYPGHDGKMFVIALLPLLVWRMLELLEKPTLKNGGLLSLVLGLSLLAWHVQMTYFTLWGLFFIWLLWLIKNYVEQRSIAPLIPRVGLFWIAVFLGLGIGFIQLYPNMAFVNEAMSMRGVDRGYEYAASWSLHWPELFSVWIPDFVRHSVGTNTYWSLNPFKLNSEYPGAMALLLGILAVVSKPTYWRFFWVGVSVFAIGYAMGDNSFIWRISYELIPGVDKFRAASMIMFWFSFSWCVLAAFLLADVCNGSLFNQTESSKNRWKKGLLIAVAAIFGLCLLFSNQGAAWGIISALQPQVLSKEHIFAANFNLFLKGLWLWFVLCAGVLITLFLYVNGRVSARTFCIVVAAVSVVDLFRVNADFIKTVDPKPIFSTPPEVAALQPSMDEDPFRVMVFPGTFGQENAAGIHHLEQVGGFHDNELIWYRRYRGNESRNYLAPLLQTDASGQARLDVNKLSKGTALLNLAGVRYFLIGQGGKIYTIKNNNALGRVHFVPEWEVVDSATVMQRLLDPHHPYSRLALLHEPLPQLDSKTQLSSESFSSDTTATGTASIQATFQRYTPNYRKARITVPRDGVLRFSEVFYPGWEMRIDGEIVDIVKSDGTWMAAAVKKGEHTIEMRPKSLYAGFGLQISILSLVLVLAPFGFSAVRRKIKKGKE